MKDALKNIINNIAKLIDLKSILSVLVVGTLCYLTLNGVVDQAVFTAIASSIITYYFTRKGE